MNLATRKTKTQKFLLDVLKFALGEQTRKKYLNGPNIVKLVSYVIPEPYELSENYVEESIDVLNVYLQVAQKNFPKSRAFGAIIYNELFARVSRNIQYVLRNYPPQKQPIFKELDRIESELDSIKQERSLRRLPMRSPTLAGSCRSATTIGDFLQIRLSVLRSVAPKFLKWDTNVAPGRVMLDKDYNVKSVSESILQAIQRSPSNIVYFEIQSPNHVFSALLYKCSNTLVVLNSFNFRDEIDIHFRPQLMAFMKTNGMAVDKIYIFPQDLPGFESYNLQSNDKSRAEQGQCQDWSIIMAYLFAKEFDCEDVPKAQDETTAEYFDTFPNVTVSQEPQPNANVIFLEKVASFLSNIIEYSEDLKSYVDIQREIGIFGGALVSK